MDTNNLHRYYGSLLSICENDDDFNLFIEIISDYINENKEIDLRSLLKQLIEASDIFKTAILDYFKEKHPSIYDEQLLNKFYEQTQTRYNSYNEVLISQYLDYNRYIQNDIINTNPEFLRYFKKDSVYSFFNSNLFSLNSIYNINLFTALEERGCFTDEHYLFAHGNLKDFLLSDRSDLVSKDIASFISAYDLEEQSFYLKDLYTLYKKNSQDIISQNKQREKVIFENLLMRNNTGLLVGKSRTYNFNFLKKYPEWQKEKIANKSLPEIMLWNNMDNLKNFISIDRLPQDQNEMLEFIKKNKYLSIIEDAPEKIKLMSMISDNGLNFSELRKIKSSIDTVYNREVLYKVVNENAGTWFHLDFGSFNKNKDDDRQLIIDIFSNLSKEKKNYLLSDKYKKHYNFNGILSGLKKNNLLEDVANFFTPEEKGCIIDMAKFKKYTEFFYGFKNDTFRLNNKKFLNTLFEKESLALQLKTEFNKGMTL